MDWTYSTRERMAVAVFAAGMATMGVEILAGRVLAPMYGSSIYTWGSIIGVFMTALSLGYYVGGRRAERYASYGALQRILLLAASYIGMILFAGEQLLRIGAALPVGQRYAALIPVAVLFGPPVFVLGFVTPYAAQLSRTESTGAASGYVFSVGTIGSIAGAFLTTFLLIPVLSVASIELLYGLVLVTGALAVRPPRRLFSWQVGAATVVIGVLVTGFAVQTTDLPVGSETVYQTQTPYQELEIRDERGVRTMYLNGQPQSAMYLNGSDAHVWQYTRYFHLPFLFRDPDEIDRVLFIGGGGFTGPKRFMSDYNATVDVVELDPAVVDAAQTYFNVSESDRLRIHVMDGRTYLRQTNATYDVIVLDAYRKDSVPFHLTTEEFMALASRRMDGNGVLVANLLSTTDGAGSAFHRAQYRTMQQVFPQVYSFPTSQSPFVQNIELVATNHPDHVSQEELLRRNRERTIGIDLDTAIRSYRDTVDTGDAPILTDDRAPVDALIDPMLDSKYVVEEAAAE